MIIEQLKLAEDLEELFRLRFYSWATRVDLEQIFPDRKFKDEYDVGSTHWGVRKKSNLVAGASMYITNNSKAIPYIEKIASYIEEYRPPYHMLRRLVVSPNERKQGLASVLDRIRIRSILDHKQGTVLVIVSQEFRIEKLARYGLKRACHLGDFRTFPGGDSILLVAKCQDLYISNEMYKPESFVRSFDGFHLHQIPSCIKYPKMSKRFGIVEARLSASRL